MPIGVDAADTDKVRAALHLIDEVWSHEQSVHTLEQFALGHVLAAEARLSESDDLVFHYWHHRQRAPFLARLPDLLARARQMPLADAPHPVQEGVEERQPRDLGLSPPRGGAEKPGLAFGQLGINRVP